MNLGVYNVNGYDHGFWPLTQEASELLFPSSILLGLVVPFQEVFLSPLTHVIHPSLPALLPCCLVNFPCSTLYFVFAVIILCISLFRRRSRLQRIQVLLAKSSDALIMTFSVRDKDNYVFGCRFFCQIP